MSDPLCLASIEVSAKGAGKEPLHAFCLNNRGHVGNHRATVEIGWLEETPPTGWLSQQVSQ